MIVLVRSVIGKDNRPTRREGTVKLEYARREGTVKRISTRREGTVKKS